MTPLNGGLLKAVSKNRMLNLVNAFSVTADLIMWFLSFILIVLCIILIDFYMLNHSCIPGIKLPWSRCVIL